MSYKQDGSYFEPMKMAANAKCCTHVYECIFSPEKWIPAGNGDCWREAVVSNRSDSVTNVIAKRIEDFRQTRVDNTLARCHHRNHYNSHHQKRTLQSLYCHRHDLKE